MKIVALRLGSISRNTKGGSTMHWEVVSLSPKICQQADVLSDSYADQIVCEASK